MKKDEKEILGYFVYLLKNSVIVLSAVAVLILIIYLFSHGHVWVPILLIFGVLFLFALTTDKTADAYTNKYWDKIKEAFETFNPFVKYK